MPSRSSPEPSRRPRISQAFVEEHRRRRYVDATAEILHEFGRPGATSTNVVQLAGGARNSFYALFRSVDDCIAYGIGLAEEALFGHLEKPCGDDGWLAEVDQAITDFFEAVAAEPVLAELLLVHAAASRTEAGRSAFYSAGERFVPLLHRGGTEAEAGGRPPLPAGIAEGMSRSIVALAAARVCGPEVAMLPAESRDMAVLIGGFYLGGEAVMASLGRPVATAR
jgi:AcrR family transcriptional regulator